MISLVLQLDSFITMIYLSFFNNKQSLRLTQFCNFIHKDPPLYGNQEDSSSGRSNSYDEIPLQEPRNHSHDSLHMLPDSGDLDNSRQC